MATLKDLQEMVKSGEFSEKLLEDETFKTEIKKILKEENGIEITDEDVPEIVEELAKSLTQNPDEKGLSEENLENISGGVSKAKVIKSVSALAGSLIGGGLGYKAGKKGADIYLTKTNDTYRKARYSWETGNAVIFHPKKDIMGDLEGSDKTLKKFAIGGATVGGLGGLGAGYWVSDYICKKFDIK